MRGAAILTMCLVACGDGSQLTMHRVADADARADSETIVVPQSPGRVVWRRLNRLEYRNSVRDLLGSSLDPGADLPADDTGYGFDNIASVLTLSPLHLELYERAARVLVDDVLRAPITTAQRFVVEGEEADSTVEYNAIIDGAYFLGSGGTLTGSVTIPRAGRYRFAMRAWEQHAGDEAAQMAMWLDGALVEIFDLSEEPAEYGVDVDLEAGAHGLTVEWLNDYYAPPEDRNTLVDWFALEGPAELDVYADMPWSKVVRCTPAALDRTCARETVAQLAARAWRRPIEDALIDSLMGLYDQAVTDGAPPIEALGLPLQAVLLSPRFIFKMEDDGALDGYALATRLAYFIWSTTPDAELVAAAAQGRLGTDEGIRAEVTRMLADPRAEALVTSYGGQWLYIRDVANVFPDPNLFPEFDEGLRAAMIEEMQRVFRGFVTEDRSLVELVTADETWVNRRLAEHYGLEDGPASDATWARTSLDDRRGLLGQAGLLTALSTPFRTSIVRRGKWVLSQLLCDEPSPPPPGVEGLIESEQSGTPRTLREKMELHKTEAHCVTCHKSMDAIGFALEGFDGIGMLRTTDNGFPIDDSGELRGQAFHGPLELAAILAADARLPRCAAQKLMTYALGRGLRASDSVALDQATTAFAERGHRFAELVKIVATSEPFRTRVPLEGE